MSDDEDLPEEESLWSQRLKLNADGALSNSKFEVMTLLLADGLSDLDAWKAITGSTVKPGTAKYFRRILRQPVCKKRLETLLDEKTTLESDPIWGNAAWQIAQVYRHSVARNDIKTMSQAMELTFKLADRRAAHAERMATLENPPETDQNGAQSGKVGRPRAENPQTKRNPSQIRSQLMAIDPPKSATEH